MTDDLRYLERRRRALLGLLTVTAVLVLAWFVVLGFVLLVWQ